MSSHWAVDACAVYTMYARNVFLSPVDKDDSSQEATFGTAYGLYPLRPPDITYAAERRMTPGRRGVELGPVLSPWSKYEFRVIAGNDLGVGQPSDPSPQYNTALDAPYVAPRNVGGGGGKAGSLTITWEVSGSRSPIASPTANCGDPFLSPCLLSVLLCSSSCFCPPFCTCLLVRRVSIWLQLVCSPIKHEFRPIADAAPVSDPCPSFCNQTLQKRGHKKMQPNVATCPHFQFISQKWGVAQCLVAF